MDNLETLSKLVQTFCEKRNWDQFHTPKELAIGLSTESNELLDLFRFKTSLQMEEMLVDTHKRVEIGSELADILFFLLRFAQMNNFDLSTALVKKIELNELRYPISKSKGNNLKYDEI